MSSCVAWPIPDPNAHLPMFARALNCEKQSRSARAWSPSVPQLILTKNGAVAAVAPSMASNGSGNVGKDGNAALHVGLNYPAVPGHGLASLAVVHTPVKSPNTREDSCCSGMSPGAHQGVGGGLRASPSQSSCEVAAHGLDGSTGGSPCESTGVCGPRGDTGNAVGEVRAFSSSIEHDRVRARSRSPGNARSWSPSTPRRSPARLDFAQVSAGSPRSVQRKMARGLSPGPGGSPRMQVPACSPSRPSKLPPTASPAQSKSGRGTPLADACPATAREQVADGQPVASFQEPILANLMANRQAYDRLRSLGASPTWLVQTIRRSSRSDKGRGGPHAGGIQEREGMSDDFESSSLPWSQNTGSTPSKSGSGSRRMSPSGGVSPCDERDAGGAELQVGNSGKGSSQSKAPSYPDRVAGTFVGKGKGAGKGLPAPQAKGAACTECHRAPDKDKVVDKERGKGAGKAPPPPGKAGPPTKGAPGKGPAKGAGKDKGALPKAPEPRKPDIRPGVPMKKLYWSSFRLASKEEADTVWGAIDKDYFCADAQQMDQLFADERGAGARVRAPQEADQAAKTPRVRKVQVLSNQRRQQICVCLARMPSIHETCEAIRTLDFEKLDREQVELLLLNIPSPEEIKLLQKAEDEQTIDEANVWATAEEFILMLMSVPHFILRLQVWGFENSFQEHFDTIASAQSAILQGCECMLKSKSIRHLLGLILSVGNYLNGGTPRGRADGFTIDVLTQVKTVKMTQSEKVGTLVDYLVQEMESKYPGELQDFLSPGQDAEQIRRAARPKLEETSEEIQRFRGKADGLLRMVRAKQEDPVFVQHCEILAMCTAELEDLQMRQVVLLKKYSEMCAWFKMDEASTKRTSSDFFGVIQQFMDDVDLAYKAWHVQQQTALRRQRSQSEGFRPRQRLQRSHSVGPETISPILGRLELPETSLASPRILRRGKSRSHSLGQSPLAHSPKRKLSRGDSCEGLESKEVASEVQNCPLPTAVPVASCSALLAPELSLLAGEQTSSSLLHAGIDCHGRRFST